MLILIFIFMSVQKKEVMFNATQDVLEIYFQCTVFFSILYVKPIKTQLFLLKLYQISDYVYSSEYTTTHNPN